MGVMICCTIWIPESKNRLRTVKHEKLNLHKKKSHIKLQSHTSWRSSSCSCWLHLLLCLSLLLLLRLWLLLLLRLKLDHLRLLLLVHRYCLHPS